MKAPSSRRWSVRLCFAILAWQAAHSLSAQNYVPGQTYFGRNNYIEYIAGNMPVILSAPHGGSLTPAELPNRSSGTFGTDLNTEDLTRKIRQAFVDRFGAFPHTIICRLDRDKIDCNREIGEGAGGHALTEISWNDFQDFISSSRQTVTSQFTRGLYLDMHGHGHTIQRLELGYLLDSSLDLTDATLDSGNYGQITSIRNLDVISPSPFSQLLRGTNSLGGLLASRGYPSVPSPAMPTPDSDPYFNGGYNTLTHGSRNSGTVSAIQIECNLSGVRDTSANRSAFAAQLADATGAFVLTHFGIDLVDLDNDRLSNILEHALGGDPISAASAPFPQAGMAGGKLALTFNRVPANTDITLTVQANDSTTGTWTDLARSLNGGAFTSLVGGVAIAESGSGPTRTVEVRDIYLTSDIAHPQRFMRLEVTRP